MLSRSHNRFNNEVANKENENYIYDSEEELDSNDDSEDISFTSRQFESDNIGNGTMSSEDDSNDELEDEQVIYNKHSQSIQHSHNT